jgi:hypothetical protein
MNDQRALADQLDDLERLAVKEGMYDAHDWMRTARGRVLIAAGSDCRGGMNNEERRAKNAVQAAKAKWGNGWAHLSEEQRKGAVALEVLAVIVGQDEESAPPQVRRLQQVAELALSAVEKKEIP